MPKHPVTMAVRALRAAKVAFEPHLYPWQPHGIGRGARRRRARGHQDADLRARDPRAAVHPDARRPRGLDEEPRPRDWHQDRRALRTRRRRSPLGPIRLRFLVGGTSPFGLKRAMPVYMQQTIVALPVIYINGGARGFLLAIDPREAERVLAPTLVDVAV